MQVVSVHGGATELRAAALIGALRARGGRIAAARAALPARERMFVARHGALWPNRSFWLEWASGIALAEEAAGVTAEMLVVAVPPGAAAPQFPHTVALDAAALPLRRDRFGRPRLTAGVAALGLAAPPAQPGPGGRPWRIGIVGSEQHCRDTDPAALVALADATDRAGIGLAPVFLDPPDVLASGLPGDLDGLLLFARDLPAFGLCLGMQTMVTAVLRRACWPDAALEETAGPGARRSFVRLRDPAGRPLHRLGECALHPLAGSRLARLLTGGAAVRMNHRFAMSAAAQSEPRLDLILYRGADGIVDAIEAPDKRFFVALQGHAELGCDARLHGLWDGFIGAVRRPTAAGLRSGRAEGTI
jgi:hypothetical protein